MKQINYALALGACCLAALGCSEKTKVETKEALKASGEAVKAAAEDTKVNAKKAAEVVKSAGEKAKEEFSSPPPSNPPANDADNDGTPDSQETQP
jgi:hypothetical protein